MNTNTIVTFRHTTKYAGGRSHRNIDTLEFYGEKDLMSLPEYFGIWIFFDNDEEPTKVLDAHGKTVMDCADYKRYMDTRIGRMNFGDDVFYSKKLGGIDTDEYKALDEYAKLEYINLYSDCAISRELLDYATDIYGDADVFEFDDKKWKELMEEMSEEEEL